MKQRSATAFVLFLGLLAHHGDSAAEDAPAWDGTVSVHGAFRAMFHEGRTGTTVNLHSVLPSKTLYAVGTLTDLAGEVTIVGGKAYISTADGESARTAVVSESQAGATLLVTANVASWQRVSIDSPIAFEDLDEALGKLARAAGMDLEKPFPFVLEGTFEDLDWHVVDGRRLQGSGSSHQDHLAAAIRTRRERTGATLVGFYSQHDQGVFTHMGSMTHVHCVVDDPVASGHVDGVTVPAGTVVMFPGAGGNSSR